MIEADNGGAHVAGSIRQDDQRIGQRSTLVESVEGLGYVGAQRLQSLTAGVTPPRILQMTAECSE